MQHSMDTHMKVRYVHNEKVRWMHIIAADMPMRMKELHERIDGWMLAGCALLLAVSDDVRGFVSGCTIHRPRWSSGMAG
jgi:hypothetical protein